MSYSDRLPFTWSYGKPAATTRGLVVYSLSNAAMTVTCNGTQYNVAWSAVGTDRGSGPAVALYAGQVTLTGLAADTSYTLSVTQSGTTRTGTIQPWASTDSDFAVWGITCDRSGVEGEGMYAFIRDYAETGSLPTCALLHNDDHGYVDTATTDDSANTGHSTTGLPGTTLKEYDFACAYAAFLGLLGPAAAAGLSPNYLETPISFGRTTDRIWCRENIPILRQWGNHEFGNLGTWIDPATTPSPFVANAYHDTDPATGGYDGPALNVWNALFAPTQPVSIANLDTRANHWGVVLGGNLRICATDNITRNSGSAKTAVFGNNQIDDVLSYLNNLEPFKIVLINHSVRTLYGGSGGHYSLWDASAALKTELNRLLRDASTSLMGLSTTNGASGQCFLLHGDNHVAYVLWHRANDGTLREGIYSISTATVNGSTGHGLDLNIVTGGVYYSDTTAADEYGSHVIYRQPGFNGGQPHAARIEIYGSRTPKEMKVALVDATGTDVWRGKWYPKGSNFAFDSDYEIPKVMMVRRK